MIQRLSNRLFDVLRTLFRRGALFVLAILMASSLTLTPVLSPTANAQGFTDLLSLVPGGLTAGLSSCAIETVGWVICPTMRSIARLADYGFSYINKNFLRIDYNIASTSSGTYTAWALMRNVANALFVVAFMILIYSQLTGRGGGYNIKRLVPKLLIAAVLVNISYYLCVAIIDVTNVLGDSILEILAGKSGISSKVGTSVMPVGAAAQAYKDGTLTSITSSVLSKTGVAWVLLAPVAAVVVSVATVCAAGIVLLIMRKTVVAMLILISPVLFVAYLLPNLERFFFQGVRLFLQLLLLYPIIALLLGAGQIVSATIVTVGTNDANYRVSGDNYTSLGGGSGSAITDLTAAAAAVLPLLAVWFVFKNMSSVMSTAGSRLSASVSGRRGGKDDEKARVTGNATAGAASKGGVGGLGGIGGAGGSSNRRQAYSRNRRHSSAGNSSIKVSAPDSTARAAGAANSQVAGGGAAAAAQNSLDAAARGEGSEKTQQQLADLQQDAQFNGQSGDIDVNAVSKAGDVNAIAKAGDVNASAKAGDVDVNAVTQVLGGGGGGNQKDKPITAKELFSSLNRSHASKDKDRKFSSGPAPAGSAVGQASGGGGGQPTGPSVSYNAPQIAQNSNIISGNSASQQPMQVVAVPVQIDSSSLLGQSQNYAPENVIQPPTSGTEEKAKARAQKYIFDAENDLEEARNEQDILGHSDAPSEQPHVTTKHDDEKDTD